MTIKTACLTGITGQTGSYLAEILLREGYKVFGLVRRSSSFSTGRIDHLYTDPHLNGMLELVYGDLSDYSSIVNFVTKAEPELFINCAAMSHVRVSFDVPEYTLDITGTGTVRCLEALKNHSPKTHFIQASSSEMFGNSPPPQNEQTLFHPRSPYAVAKLSSYWTTVNYREAYGMFASNAISFNHEGPRRLETFVTRKITMAAARIKLGLQDKLYLGNLDAQRDWGFAGDTAEAIYKIVTADNPNDYVVATGEMHSVKEFLEKVFEKLNLSWQDYVEFDARYLRPAEVDALCGDSTKLRTDLNWQPKVSFDELVEMMVHADMKIAEMEKICKG